MKGRKYLRRLTIVILFGVLIPALAAFAVFYQYTLNNRAQSAEEAYNKAFTTYTSLLDRKIQELESYSARISVESRERGNLLQNGFESMDPYRIYLLTQALRQQYLRADVSDWGIYSYNDQRVLTPEYSCTLQDFLRKYTGQSGADSGLADFFSDENYKLRNTLFSTTQSGGTQNSRFIVGVCTRIGYTNDPAIIFYLLSPEDLKDSMVMVGGEGIAYYLLDQDENVLLSWGDLPEESADTILQQSGLKQGMGARPKARYDIKSRYSALSMTAYVWKEPLQDTITELLNSMWLVLFGIVLLMLIVSGAAIYVSYKPVQELTKNFDYNGGNEFELILNRMNASVSKIDEQQMLIMDLLMNHLLYGVPISAEQIQQLGVTNSCQYYCVFLMDGYSFVNSEMTKKLTAKLEQSCKARIFVTDWYEGNCNVLVCFMAQQDTAALEQKLRDWLQDNCNTAGELYAGPAYDRLENVQLSFRSCVERRKKKQQTRTVEGGATPKRIKQKEMLQQILAYLEDNFRDAGISQVQVADQFQISNYTLSRMFKNEMGVGFVEYLSAKRLEYAKELLLTTNHPVREVALLSGFTNENYFSRTFKLYTGFVPSAFRKQ